MSLITSADAWGSVLADAVNQASIHLVCLRKQYPGLFLIVLVVSDVSLGMKTVPGQRWLERGHVYKGCAQTTSVSGAV